MTTRRDILAAGLAGSVAVALPAHAAGGGDLSALRDFDFLVGTWRSRQRRLAARLKGSTDWIEFDGALTHRSLNSGYANSGDNLFRVPGGDYRGVSLRSYDPQAGEWLIWWLDGRNPLGGLGPPLRGRFRGDHATLENDDTFEGRPIRVRATWDRLSADRLRWEQAFSPDGGRTWEVNWTADFFRDDDAPPPAPPATVRDPDGVGAFDLRAGRWDVRHRRLKDRLAGSTEWIDFGGEQTWWPTLGGAGNVDENLFRMPGGEYRGVTLRAFDPATRQWAIWWLDGRSPTGPVDPPLLGRFKDGVGTFYADETFQGRPVKVRFIWSRISRDAAYWDQAFSPDGGRTWETNWITWFTRAGA